MKFYEEWSIGPSNKIKKQRLDGLLQMMLLVAPWSCCTSEHWVRQERNTRFSTLDHEKVLTIVSLLVDRTAEEVLMSLAHCT
jgi:hypothetical protein